MLDRNFLLSVLLALGLVNVAVFLNKKGFSLRVSKPDEPAWVSQQPGWDNMPRKEVAPPPEVKPEIKDNPQPEKPPEIDDNGRRPQRPGRPFPFPRQRNPQTPDSQDIPESPSCPPQG